MTDKRERSIRSIRSCDRRRHNVEATFRTTVRGLVVSAVLGIFAHAVYAQSVERVDVLNAGIFEVDILGRSGTDEAPGNVLNTLGRARLVARTGSVPLRRCITFGFQYIIRGAPAGADIPLRMVTHIPAPGVRNPHTGRTLVEMETTVSRQIGHRHLRAYTLEHQWELMPGVWTLEIWQGRRRLAAQSFTLAGKCQGNCSARDDHDACTQASISFLSDATLQPRARRSTR
jgi:hypothetical protein